MVLSPDVRDGCAVNALHDVLDAIHLTKKRQSSVWLNIQPCLAAACELFSRTLLAQEARIAHLEGELGHMSHTVQLLLDDRDVKERRYNIDRSATQKSIATLHHTVTSNYARSVQSDNDLALNMVAKLDEMNSAVQHLSALYSNLSAALAARQDCAPRGKPASAERTKSERRLMDELSHLSAQWKDLQEQLARTPQRSVERQSRVRAARSRSCRCFRWVYYGALPTKRPCQGYSVREQSQAGLASVGGRMSVVEWSAQLPDVDSGEDADVDADRRGRCADEVGVTPARARLFWASASTILVRCAGLYEVVVCVSSCLECAPDAASAQRRVALAPSPMRAASDEVEVFLYVNNSPVIALPQASTARIMLPAARMTRRDANTMHVGKPKRIVMAAVAAPQLVERYMCTKTMHHHIYLPSDATVHVSLDTRSFQNVSNVYLELTYVV